MPTEFLPILLTLCSAFLFALGGQMQSRGLGSGTNSRTGTAISICSAALCYWLVAPFMLEPSHFLNSAVFIFVLVGIFRPSLSANLSVAGIRYLGPTLSSTMSSTTPVFGAVLGIWLLGELFNWQIGLGTAGIIGAIVLLSSSKLKLTSDWPVWALFLPIGSALIRALAHVFSKIGMEQIPDPYFVGLVGFSVSAVITVLSLQVKRSSEPIAWKSGSPYWFVCAGSAFASSIFMLNHALLVGQLTVVAPIIATTPIFSILLSIFIFKREQFTLRLLGAICMVVSSVILIALSR
ncbi:MAG: DMT family transporter [Rhodospirillales bacterium]|nr:DMT family transporter [Rhodospirillales bacterium]